MSYSVTYTDTETFTRTHARHMAAKVATDLKRLQRFYGHPSDGRIADFEAEVIEFLKEGYLGTVRYGFRRNGNWIEPTLSYSAHDLEGASANDDDPGRVLPGADTRGASFYSYLTYQSVVGGSGRGGAGEIPEPSPVPTRRSAGAGHRRLSECGSGLFGGRSCA